VRRPRNPESLLRSSRIPRPQTHSYVYTCAIADNPIFTLLAERPAVGQRREGLAVDRCRTATEPSARLSRQSPFPLSMPGSRFPYFLHLLTLLISDDPCSPKNVKHKSTNRRVSALRRNPYPPGIVF